MTIEALKFIDDTLNGAGIKYEFAEWSGLEIPTTYFVGEFVEVPSLEEDGYQEASFILTGTTSASWLELMEAKETIESLFPSVGGCVKSDLKNCHSMAVFFEYSTNIPTDDMDIKRIKVNLIIKEWKG